MLDIEQFIFKFELTSIIQDYLIMDSPILLLILLIVYFTALSVLKNIGFMQKIVSEHSSNCCPKCNESLERVRKNNSDRMLNLLTFQMFDFKRYACNNCDWEGLRWEDKFEQTS